MSEPSTVPIVEEFVRSLTGRLDPDSLDGPVRLDNTHTFAIIPVKGKGPIHAPIHGGVNETGVEAVVRQIAATPSLKALLKTE